ncbi:MAG: hypothetical protein QM747_13130 [Nocardioides sp.]
MERATGVDVVLRKFEVRSVSAGEDAQGEALVIVEYNAPHLPRLERVHQHRRVRSTGLSRSDQPHRARVRHVDRTGTQRIAQAVV